MSNCLFAYPDWLLSTQRTPTFLGGSWETALPLNNLLDKKLYLYARTTDATEASTAFEVDMHLQREIRVVVIPKHNLSSTAVIRILISQGQDFAPTEYDSGAVLAWGETYYPVNMLPSSHESYADNQISPEAAAGLVPSIYFVMPEAVQGRYVRVIISDVNNPDGYIELSRLIVAPAWQPAINMSYGASVQWEATTDVKEAPRGTEWINTQSIRRTASISLESMTEEEALIWPFEMQRRLGNEGEIFFVFDPDSTSTLMKQRSFLARMKTLSAIDRVYFNGVSTKFEFRERL